MDKTSCIYEIIQSTAQSSANKISISDLCAYAGVSRSGYYAYLKAEPVRQAREDHDKKDFDLILIAYTKRGYSKGVEGIHMALLHMDPPVIMNVKKIRRLMHKFNLVCPIRRANPYRQMARALQTSNIADNLLHREFECYGPRVVLLTDITYLPYKGIFAYLSTILDAYTKQILAYVVSPSLKVDFVLETVNILIRDYGTELKAETILHSDQGCHYTSYSFIEILKDKKLRQSMSRRGNCWDNAPQESFFGHMKDSIKGDLACCKTYEEVKGLVDDYIDYYNNERYQWYLAKLSPNEFYEFVTTGIYPLKIPNPPSIPEIQKKASALGYSDSQPDHRGAGAESGDSTLAAERPGSA